MTHRPTRLRRQRTQAAKPTVNPASQGHLPRCLGLTGGIGSGKSTALSLFQEFGAAVLSSDQIVTDLYRDPDVAAEVIARFGDGVRAADGGVDRQALAGRVFDDATGRIDLEAILHPRIARAREAWVAAERSRVPPPRLVVCEVPLLYEVAMEGQFDAVLVVTASPAVRRERVSARGQDFDARAATQLPEEEKVARADTSFVNNGSLAALRRWVAECVTRYAT
jgi:dephospho-CoA kinase